MTDAELDQLHRGVPLVDGGGVVELDAVARQLLFGSVRWSTLAWR